MQKRRKVGAYAVIAMGLILAMGFAPMERGMAEESSAPTTDVMQEISVEDINGTAIMVMQEISVEDIVQILCKMNLQRAIPLVMHELHGNSDVTMPSPLVMQEISVESVGGTTILVMQEISVEDVELILEVLGLEDLIPLVMQEISVESVSQIVGVLVMQEISVEDINNLIIPLVMQEISVE